MLLSEMFGVKRDEKFMVDGYTGPFMIRLVGNFERLFVLRFGEYVQVVNINLLQDLISRAPSGIIHLPPPLTDEQREQLRAIWTLGGRWIAKDETGNVYAYDSKPQKMIICCHWNNDDGKCFTVNRELSVCSIVSWSDPEPLDIGKALGV